MAVSAYGPQGRLKKHALLGTSMLADPSRKEEVKGFRALQQEAATSGDTSRTAGVKRLKKRYAAFAAPHESRLEAISQEQQGLGAKIQAARDPAREQALKAEQGEYSAAAGKLQGLSGKKLADAMRTLTYKEGADAELYYQNQRTRNAAIEMGHTGKKLTSELALRDSLMGQAGLGTDAAKENPVYDTTGGLDIDKAYKAGLVGPGTYNDKYVQNYYNWKLAESNKQVGAYEGVINAEIDLINKSFIPLEEERADRGRRLQDRAELYNMFLGT